MLLNSVPTLTAKPLCSISAGGIFKGVAELLSASPAMVCFRASSRLTVCLTLYCCVAQSLHKRALHACMLNHKRPSTVLVQISPQPCSTQKGLLNSRVQLTHHLTKLKAPSCGILCLFLLQAAYCLLQAFYCRLPFASFLYCLYSCTAYLSCVARLGCLLFSRQLPAAYGLLQVSTAYCCLPASCCLWLFASFLLPTILSPVSYCLLQISY